MTTENVAILFTDVVGSTEPSQRLLAEAPDEVRREYFSRLRQTAAEVDGAIAHIGLEPSEMAGDNLSPGIDQLLAP